MKQCQQPRGWVTFELDTIGADGGGGGRGGGGEKTSYM